MKKKIGILALLCVGLHLLDACCGENKPFFDYQKLLVGSELLLITATHDTVLTLDVQPDDIDYYASGLAPGFTPAAYGESCPVPGEEGTKYKMEKVEILADKDFNDTLPAGASLSSIFFDGRAASIGAPISQTVSDLEFLTAEWDFVVFTPHRPTHPDQSFVLTVKVTKTDGSVAVGKVGNVKFR